MRYLLAIVATFFVTTANAVVQVEKLDIKATEQALYVQQKELPTVNILFSFKAGTIYEGRYPHGTANLLANLLMQGTDHQTAQQIQQRLEKLASNVIIYSSRDSINIEIKTLAEKLEPTLLIVKDILTYSNFPDKEVKIMKASMMQAIRQQFENPGYIAGYRAKKEFYGPDNVKAYISNLGTEMSIEAISTNDLINYYQEYITMQNMSVSVVTSVDKPLIEKMLDKYLGKMHVGSRKDLIYPTVVTHTNRTIVEKQLPQTTVLMYTAGIDRNSPDYYTSVVFNYMLGGGGFSSRLMEELREKRGLTYGVNSAFEYDLPYTGLFTINLQTANKNAYKVEKLIRQEVQKVIDKGFTQAELDAAKNFLVGSYPIRLRTSDKLLNHMQVMQEFGLPLDYLNTWSNNVNNVTLDQVNEFAKQLLKDEVTISRVFVGGVEK
jgi:zinc protease